MHRDMYLMSVRMPSKQLTMIYDRDKKYNLGKLILLNFKVSPGYATAVLFQNIFSSILPALMTLALSTFIDSINLGAEKGTLFRHFLMIILLMILQSVLSSLSLFTHRNLRIAVQCRCEYEGTERVASLDYIHIENKDKYENISRVVTDMSNYINNSYQLALLGVILSVRVVSIAGIFFKYNIYWMGLAIILSMIPGFILSYNCGGKVYEFYKKSYSHSLQMNHQTYILKSRETVNERTLFEYSDKIEENWERLRGEYFQKQLALHLNAEKELKIPLILSWIIIGILFILLIGAYFSKAITIGLLMAMISSLIELNGYTGKTLLPMSSKVSQVRGFILDINEFLKYSFDVEYLTPPADHKIPFETLEFKNVTFCYPNSGRKVLDDISFIINAGKSYAFVGKNGSGKSTIIKLILRMYDDYSGQILLNGKDIKTYSEIDIKSFFGVLFQDYAKYQVSLKDNIELGLIKDRKEVSQRKKDAIKRMKLDDLAKKLPNGWGTPLGKIETSGQGISGGEWQRVAIARILASEKQVYILDEPTSSIDPLLEESIFEWFSDSNTKTETSIVISHRLGITKMVDEIYVMEQGKIIEQGNYKDLMEKGNLFFDMYTKQRRRFV